MSRRSTKSKLKLATVEKSTQLLKHEYHSLQLAFINSYSFYTQTFLTRIANKAQEQLLQYPVQILLTNVSKKFCLNQLQLVFMYHLFQSSQWDVNNEVIITNAKSIQIEEDDKHKQALLYFYFISYATKYYLNGQADAEIFLAVLIDEVSDFEKIFEQWIESTPKNVLVIQPIELNRCFKEMVRKETDNLKTDYNKLVEQLLLISPSYKLIENIERTRLQEFKEVQVPRQPLLLDSQKKSDRNSKKIKLNLNSQNDQQEVNDHLGNIFQSIQFMDGDAQPNRQGPVTRGSSYGMHQISDIGGFIKRKASSDLLSKMFNLQRSSIYDWP